mgnify:CR=1 FL=1
MEKICLVCGKEFLKPSKISKKQWQKRIYCSTTCQIEVRRTSVERECLTCSTKFSEQPSRIKSGRGKYCSRECKDMALVGHIPWNKVGKIQKCLVCGNEFGVKPSRIKLGKAKYCSRKCMSIAFIGRPSWNKGKKMPPVSFETRKKLSQALSGKNSRFWQGGITPLNFQIRGLFEYKNWLTTIFERDNYTCQICDKRGNGDLNANHIKKFSVILKENNIKTWEDAVKCSGLWGSVNGITLCKDCHNMVTRHEEEWESYFIFNLKTRGFIKDKFILKQIGGNQN